MKKRIPCQSVHNGTKCWLPEHGSEEDHWAMVKVEGSDKAVRVTWREDAKVKQG